MTISGEHFGELIDRHRKEFKKPGEKEFGISQLELGQMAGIAGATLSRMVRREIPVKYETGIAIIRALKLRGQDRHDAEKALQEYIDTFELPSPYIESGTLLKKIIDQYGIKPSAIANHIGTSATFVSAWWGGSKAIPPHLFNTVYRFLIVQGVSKEDMESFKRVYTKDMIINNSQLVYLTLQQRKRLGAFAMSEIV